MEFKGHMLTYIKMCMGGTWERGYNFDHEYIVLLDVYNICMQGGGVMCVCMM